MKPEKYFQKDGPIPFNHSPHSPHSIIFNLISPNTTVLDIGCNSGLLGKELLKKHVVSDGVDINPDLINQAQTAYRRTFVRNLYDPHLNITPAKYDYIVLSDILEHLPRPDLLLLDLSQYLKNSGTVIVSLPNIARLEIRLQLLAGNFNYKPGILSSDHLRFFTKSSAISLFKSANYKTNNTIPTGLGHLIPFFPTLLAFQFIYLLSKK